MGRSVACKACIHPDRPTIDAALAGGTAVRLVGKRHGLASSSLQRHKRHIGTRPNGSVPTAGRKPLPARLELATVDAQLVPPRFDPIVERARVVAGAWRLATAAEAAATCSKDLAVPAVYMRLILDVCQEPEALELPWRDLPPAQRLERLRAAIGAYQAEEVKLADVCQPKPELKT